MDWIAVARVRPPSGQGDVAGVSRHGVGSCDEDDTEFLPVISEKRNEHRRCRLAVAVRKFGQEAKAVRHLATL
jgi:hypothetical protein